MAHLNIIKTSYFQTLLGPGVEKGFSAAAGGGGRVGETGVAGAGAGGGGATTETAAGSEGLEAAAWLMTTVIPLAVPTGMAP